MLQEFLQTKIQSNEFRVNTNVREGEQSETQIALHAMILTGGARYQTKHQEKSEDYDAVGKWPDEDEREGETAAF
jgi:hypothetical protein